MVPLAIDTFSLKLGVSGDSILGIFAKGKLPLRCISNLTLGVTNEGREAISCVFRKRTPEDAEDLMGRIAKNHEDWSAPEPPPPQRKRGMFVLSPEDMREAKKSIKEKGIKAEDVKNLPPIEKLCEPTTHPPMVEVHSLLDFNASDIPHGKPLDQCLDEFDNFIIKQSHFNERI